MRQSEFEKYVQQPHLLEASTIAELQQLVNDYPYFQSAHLLLTLAGKLHNPAVYQQSLRKTAIVSTNRAHLYQLVETIEKAQLPAQTGVEETASNPPFEIKKEEAPTEREVIQAVELSTESARVESASFSDSKALEEPDAVEMLGKEIGREVVGAQIDLELSEAISAQAPAPVNDPESFGDWLTYLKKNNGQSYEDISEEVEKAKLKQREKEKEQIEAYIEKTENRKQKHKAIIDRIIEKNPGVIRQKEESKFFAADAKAKESLLENEHLVTETLARIYALQGSVNKAIRAYEILSLKFPQKSVYFASLIEKLRNNQ